MDEMQPASGHSRPWLARAYVYVVLGALFVFLAACAWEGGFYGVFALGWMTVVWLITERHAEKLNTALDAERADIERIISG